VPLQIQNHNPPARLQQPMRRRHRPSGMQRMMQALAEKRQTDSARRH
jgi:hypothetical protein